MLPSNVIRLPGTYCEICKSGYKSDGWGRQSMTFGFCCSRCVSKACRVVRRHNRRGRVAGARGTLYGYHWLTLLFAHDFSCAMCSSREGNLTLDHIRPLSQGGDNLPHNIQPLCPGCHQQKDNIKTRSQKETSIYAPR